MWSMKFDLRFKENEVSSTLKFDCRSKVLKTCWSRGWFDRIKMSKENWHRKKELS